jgi:UDP-sulfoquinovose synthase
LCSRRAGHFTGRKAPLAGKVRSARANAVGVSAMNMKQILVLGGDGFCGWPTTLHLASQVLNQAPTRKP